MKYGFTVTPGSTDKNLEYAANYNFSVMEINLPAVVPFEMMFHDNKIRILRKFAEENLLSYAFNIPFTLGIADILPEVKNKAVDYLKKCMEFASLIDARYINMHFGKFYWFPFEDVMRRRTLDRLSESLKTVLDIAADKNIVIALENLYSIDISNDYYFLGDNIYDYEYLFDKVNSPNLKICFNSGHANLAEGVEEYIDKLGDKFHSIHLCDNYGNDDDHLLPGEGTINWRGFIDKLNEKEFRGPFVSCCPDSEPHEVIKSFELQKVKSREKIASAM